MQRKIHQNGFSVANTMDMKTSVEVGFNLAAAHVTVT